MARAIARGAGPAGLVVALVAAAGPFALPRQSLAVSLASAASPSDASPISGGLPASRPASTPRWVLDPPPGGGGPVGTPGGGPNGGVKVIPSPRGSSPDSSRARGSAPHIDAAPHQNTTASATAPNTRAGGENGAHPTQGAAITGQPPGRPADPKSGSPAVASGTPGPPLKDDSPQGPRPAVAPGPRLPVQGANTGTTESTGTKLWNFMKPTGEDAASTVVGTAQSLLGSRQDVAAASEAAASSSADSAAVLRSILNDPASSSDMKIRAGLTMQAAEQSARDNSELAAKSLGPARLLPEGARSVLTKTPWDTVKDVALATDHSIPVGAAARALGPVAKQIPYAGAVVTAGQSIFDATSGDKSWQRATAEGVGSLLGGAAGAIGMGALGSAVPVAGTAAGVAVGGAVGSYAGGKLADGLLNLTNLATGTHY